MILRWFAGGLAKANRTQHYMAGFARLEISTFVAPTASGGGSLIVRRRRR